MTVLTEHNKLIHNADGVETVYAYDFYVPDLTYLFVFFDDTQQLSGWTADGEGNPTGGNITYDTPPPGGTVITHIRYLPVTQLIDWRPYDPFGAEVNEDAMDKLTMLCQQITDEAQRAINLPLADDGLTQIIFPDYSPGKIIGWDDTERKMESYTLCKCPDPYVDLKRRLYGKIDGATGALVKGKAGFIPGRTSAGVYTVTFDAPITSAYTVIVGLSEARVAVSINCHSETINGFTVNINETGGDGDPVDVDWSFILRYREGDKLKGADFTVLEYGRIDTDGTILNGTPNFSIGGETTGQVYKVFFNPTLADSEYTVVANGADPDEKVIITDMSPIQRGSAELQINVGNTAPIEFMVMRA